MAKRAKGMKPRIERWEDFSKDLGLIDPSDLLAAIKQAGVFVYDLETTGLNCRRDRIEGVAFFVPPLNGAPMIRAWFPFREYTFMCHDQGGKLLDLRPAMPQAETMDGLRPIWEELENIIDIAQHRKFDDGFLYFASGTPRPIIVNNICADSMLADFCSDERRRRYGLKYRVRQEFGHQMTTYSEAVRGQSLLPFCNAKPLGVYAMDDCYWTYRHHERALAQLREQAPAPKKRTELRWTVEKQLGRVMGKLERIYWGIDVKISAILMEMENSGVLIDWQWLREVEERLLKEKDEISNRIEKYLGWPLNPNSGKQVADALFAPPPDGLGLPLTGIPIGKTGDPSTADKVIKHFSRFHPLVADILKCRSIDTLLTAFVRKLIKLATASSDGRIYSHFNQTRTVICRLSCISSESVLSIRLGDEGFRRSIKIAELGEFVGRCEILTHEGRFKKIKRLINKGPGEMFRVETWDGRSLVCTKEHRFLTPDGWKALSELEVGSSVTVHLGELVADDQFGHRTISGIVPVGIEDVWDIEVESDHSYIAHGFVNHNSSDPINLQNQPREKNLVRKAYVAYRKGIDEEDMLLYGSDFGQIELRVAAHLANEESMIEVYQMGGICRTNDGEPCPRYTWYECHDCEHCGPPLEVTPGNFTCVKCASAKVEHQARCRHVDLHQRTAEDVNVKRNPLAKNCVTGDSLILTEHGLLRMDEVVIEEGRAKKTIGIMSDDGKIRPTESTWGGGVQPVADVHMEYGLKVTATYDHEFFVMREGKVERVPVEDLKPGDPVIIMVGRNVHGTETALPDVGDIGPNGPSYKDIDLPTKLTKSFARFLGYYVAEGRQDTSESRHRYQIQFGFSKTSADMIVDFATTLREFVGSRVNVWENDDAIFYTICSKKINAWFDILGPGYGSADKNIPACIRRAPWELKREFLRGYFEGDGTNKAPSRVTGKGSYTVSATSKSETLIRQLHAEMTNIGILGFIHSEWRDTQKGQQLYWAWSIRRKSDLQRFYNKVGFVSQEKQQRLESALVDTVTDRSNRFLDGVEPLLETIYDKTKRKQKDKLREVIKRSPEQRVRFGDTRVALLADVLPEEIQSLVEAGIWTAKVRSVEDAGEAPVFDVYEPERAAMVVNSCVILDCNFGTLYRMGAPKFCVYADLFDADGMPMVNFAREIILRWHAAYPRIADFHERTERELERNDWIAHTIFGRRRRLDQEARLNHYRAVTQGIQFQVSGSAQDIMKSAMIRIYEERNRRRDNARPAERKLWEKVRMLIQVHDEIILEGPKALRPEIVELVKTNMESVGKGHLRVPLAADVKSGNTWESIH